MKAAALDGRRKWPSGARTGAARTVARFWSFAVRSAWRYQATGSPQHTAALGRHLRAPGIALSAFTIFFFGFPFSGATSAPELLPQPWGHLGQLLPAGAASTALRSVAFFDGAGAAHPLLTLTLWAVAALTLLVLRLADRASAPPNEISGAAMRGSAAAAAGRSALALPGPFGGLLTDRVPAGSPVTGLLMGCRARFGVST